ncbi:head maturation protease, ClpP-related [Jeotgalibaca porci]|uniref:head maturation protease, ClpP-related n=1 Tax=Jeotgalibaca porci TaxID=1868793 RepID=UPI0035A0B190
MKKKLNNLRAKDPISNRVRVDNENEERISLLLYGDISSYSWGDGISLDSVVNALAGKSATIIDVYINSYGGDMFESIAIKNYLMRRPEKIITHIDGIAASGGSIIAMAGEEIIMPKDTEMMIHNPWTIGFGNADDFRKLADELDTANETVQETYLNHFTGERETLIQLLEEETWLTAEEALSYGLATEVTEQAKAKPEPEPESETVENKAHAPMNQGTQKVAFFNL